MARKPFDAKRIFKGPFLYIVAGAIALWIGFGLLSGGGSRGGSRGGPRGPGGRRSGARPRRPEHELRPAPLPAPTT